jgi:hypothetical protein
MSSPDKQSLQGWKSIPLEPEHKTPPLSAIRLLPGGGSECKVPIFQAEMQHKSVNPLDHWIHDAIDSDLINLEAIDLGSAFNEDYEILASPSKSPKVSQAFLDIGICNTYTFTFTEETC